jgi:uncharacterized membrane protein
MAKIDVPSLIIGVLLSLMANGIYDAIFYFGTGKPLEGYIAITLALVFASIVLLIVAIIIDWNIFRWQRKKEDAVGMVDTIEVVLNKKRANAHFQIKHNGTGKENITITSKDATGKEIKLEIPWEKIEELKK